MLAEPYEHFSSIPPASTIQQRATRVCARDGEPTVRARRVRRGGRRVRRRRGAFPSCTFSLPTAHLDASADARRRERLLILGSGWGAVALMKNVDPTLYDVSVVSPRNYFLNTPLLPGVTVGTVEARSLIEPVRRLLPGRPGDARSFEAAAVAVDPQAKTVRCRDESGITAANPEFAVPYDKLVVAVGAPCNTFGTPGVREHAVFLKEVDDALTIRGRLADLFETASLPGVSDEERREMLSVLVVGGGPTGVEFAAELHDFLKDDVPSCTRTWRTRSPSPSCRARTTSSTPTTSASARTPRRSSAMASPSHRSPCPVRRRERGCRREQEDQSQGRRQVRRLRVVHGPRRASHHP